MPKVHGSAEEERGEGSRLVHREPSRRMERDGAKAVGGSEEVEYPGCLMITRDRTNPGALSELLYYLIT